MVLDPGRWPGRILAAGIVTVTDSALDASAASGAITAKAARPRPSDGRFRAFLASARRDPPLLLAIATAVAGAFIELIADAPGDRAWLVLPVVFVAVQVVLATIRRAPAWLAPVRLGLTLGFVATLNVLIASGTPAPATALIIPVVVLGAATSGHGGLLVALAGIGLTFYGVLNPAFPLDARQRHLAVTITEILLAAGTRTLVGSLERALVRLRAVSARDRRKARHVATVESVGRLLAREGPTADALDRVMGLLEVTFGYRYPSLYLWDGRALQLGAQRNYRYPIETIGPDRGVLGRVARTGEPAFLPDARSDPDFLSADPDVRSEIAIPLLADGFLGVLNVETSGDRRLDLGDFSMMQIVGDRIAVALALGRERQALTERAALLDRLTAFSQALSQSLDPGAVDALVVSGAARVVSSEKASLTLADPADGSFRVANVEGIPAAIIGLPIAPGDGLTGRAIQDRALVVEDHLERARFARAAVQVTNADVLAAMSVPLVVDEGVIGALTWARETVRPFTAQEQEVAGLLAAQAALALVNARLHQAARDAAVTDPLTGLPNRRHFDASVQRDDELRRRTPVEDRRPRSVIMFDLDRFGQVNKQHGHAAGDRVLRRFADTLRGRARGSDLVARYGGEEFVVILDGASRDDAVRIAEEVRLAFGAERVDVGGGQLLATTVSGGCATLDRSEVEAASLLARADVALAMAKAAGRNAVVAA